MSWSLFERNTELVKNLYIQLQVLGKTVASAESCTGGLLATSFTELPGSSAFFQGGISCYSNLAKSKILGISPEILQRSGAVSKEVAIALAENAASILEADYGLALTGIAGPDGGTQDKPVGTVWWAISTQQKTHVGCFHLSGSRSDIRFASVNSILVEFSNILKGT